MNGVKDSVIVCFRDQQGNFHLGSGDQPDICIGMTNRIEDLGSNAGGVFHRRVIDGDFMVYAADDDIDLVFFFQGGDKGKNINQIVVGNGEGEAC